MTEHTLYQVDAFADRLFAGNPAGVMILDEFFPDETLQAIAMENNLAETAFAVRKGAGAYDLRWFTPGAEVPLCGHATLATAHVLWAEEGEDAERFSFDTLSGPLHVERTGEGYTLDFPADPPVPVEAPDGLAEALGTEPESVLAGQYLLAVLKDEAAVRALRPNLLALEAVGLPRGRGTAENCVCVTAPGEVCVTAEGEAYDFVSRFFAPTVGITEDPVTGSAHCMLTPYWAERLGKTTLFAFQASARGGAVACELAGDRVRLTGSAFTYLRGTIRL
ncbi:PhzF family phenazine biosynthesis protein [Parvularcula dongshanensis]|uniref:PhzF family phenazine biosynthesis protein n=1 Tax=Parvularcula dongshanensis TaxID=1173995 RepID=A0A840I527_9PROT|nr:PhzF family phenazine biosynthesis protein [Parvularcula dongshanensis]MBB4659435.1 PhzF family phenazine biosynthesis protein [Parvularcula dongshanensis]